MSHREALYTIWLGVVACAPQSGALTEGADTKEEWQRRLYAAVPVGMAGDSGRQLLVSAGFQCREGVDSVAYIWCDKKVQGTILTERWQAVLNLDQGRVFERRGNYGLIGPSVASPVQHLNDQVRPSRLTSDPVCAYGCAARISLPFLKKPIAYPTVHRPTPSCFVG